MRINYKSCLAMENLENLGTKNRAEIELFSELLNLSFEKGWMTKDEHLRVQNRTTLNEKKLELFEVMQNGNCDNNATRLLFAMRCINEVDSSSSSNKNKGDNQFFPAIVMSKLFDKSLITHEEKLAFEKQQNAENVKDKKDSENISRETVKNPMLLSPIIQGVLRYLSLADIKKCRSISHEWNSLAQHILRTRSVIKISKEKRKYTGSLFTPSEFFEQFSSFQEEQETLPFTAFRIYGDFQYPWKIKDLNEFFQSQQDNVRELVLDNLQLANEDGEKVASFDITPWIAGTPMTDANGKRNTKLGVKYEFHKMASVLIIVQDSVLVNIMDLSLLRCQINQQDQIHLRPVKLTLDRVAFFKDGNILPELCINDIVDFSRLKHIDLTYLSTAAEATQLSLVLNGNLNLEYLRLCQDIVVTNWTACTWKVNKLEMNCKPFVERTDMKIQEMIFYGTTHKIDLSVLPQTLEKLTVYTTEADSCWSSQSISMDNLHYFQLNTSVDNCLSTICQFVKFPNLVDLHVEGQNHQLEINSDLIPKTVKRLKLRHVTINWVEGSQDFNLEKLVLIHYSYEDVKRICSVLCQTKELVLNCPCKLENVVDFVEYLELKKRFEYQQRIYVGPFHWSYKFTFKESPLVDHVDREAEYYLFETQMGKALDIGKVKFREFENI